MSIFVSPIELAEDIRRGRGDTVIGALWEAEFNTGWPTFVAAHIPTSVYCNPATALAGVPSSTEGRNPMPDVDQLQTAFRAWGLRRHHRIVVYDEGRGLFAARVWWMLTWAGLKGVRILDGGLAAWCAAGLPCLTGPGNLPQSSDLSPRPGALPTMTIEEVKDYRGLLLDARERNRFSGKRELLDLQAGHIPGAVNVPARELTREDDTIRSAGEIRAALEAVGVTERTEGAVAYSGSGNHSALLIAAMVHAGLPPAAHFVGGWSQWSADPLNPVERSTEGVAGGGAVRPVMHATG